MTSIRQPSPDFLSCLTAGMPFMRTFAFGLLLTWLISIGIGTVSAHAADQLAFPARLEGGSLSSMPAAPDGYVTTKSSGPGFGLLEPNLKAMLLQAAPITDLEAGRTIELRGDIDARSVRTLAVAVRQGKREFAITSRGGEFMAAREMADILNDSGSTLIAVGKCHSSCAYLWLATRQHRLGAAANLALHATYTTEGITNHGEQWLLEIGRNDLAKWARNRELHRLTIEDMNI
jgi:hypothetical protein